MPACIEPPRALQKQQASLKYLSKLVPGRILASPCTTFVLADLRVLPFCHCNRMQGLPALV